jgi:hypothetical protein
VYVLREVVKILLESAYYELVEERECLSSALFVLLVLACAQSVQYPLRMKKFVTYFGYLKGGTARLRSMIGMRHGDTKRQRPCPTGLGGIVTRRYQNAWKNCGTGVGNGLNVYVYEQ